MLYIMWYIIGNTDSNDSCDSSEPYSITVDIQQLPFTGNCTLQVRKLLFPCFNV